jgi:hypothetical protein
LLAAQWVLKAIEAREEGKPAPVEFQRATPELVVRGSTTALQGGTRKRNAQRA